MNGESAGDGDLDPVSQLPFRTVASHHDGSLLPIACAVATEQECFAGIAGVDQLARRRLLTRSARWELRCDEKPRVAA